MNTVELYQKLAPEYDQRFSTPIALAENEVVKILVGHRRSVLDLCCGTGLAAELFQPAHYLGVDSSSAMIEQAARKHPGRQFMAATANGHGVELMNGAPLPITVTALFGSASYLNSATLANLADSQTALFLMFYAPGYIPSVYAEHQVIPQFKSRSLAQLRQIFPDCAIHGVAFEDLEDDVPAQLTASRAGLTLGAKYLAVVR